MKNQQSMLIMHRLIQEMRLRKGKLLKIAKNENSDKLIDIVTEILNFSKQQKVKGFRILTPKQMF